MSWPRSRRWQSGTATAPSVLLVGRECRSDGCGMASCVGQRPATKLAGVDRRSFPGGCQDITQRTVREEQCAGPAADARGREIQVKEQRTRNQSLIEEFVLSTNIFNNEARSSREIGLFNLQYAAAYAKRGAVPNFPFFASCHLAFTASYVLPGSIAAISLNVLPLCGLG